MESIGPWFWIHSADVATVVPGRQETSLVHGCFSMFLLAVETVISVAQGIGQETELFGELALFLPVLFPTTKAGVFHDESTGDEPDDQSSNNSESEQETGH